ncbi:MAG: hypothetical protein KC583_21045, partial [Myxococcales bacterium]|nr:hypothetical protein [Myxococcales bacterium]
MVEAEGPFMAWWAPDGGWSFVAQGENIVVDQSVIEDDHPNLPARVGALPFRAGAASVWGGWPTPGLRVPTRAWSSCSNMAEHWLSTSAGTPTRPPARPAPSWSP